MAVQEEIGLTPNDQLVVSRLTHQTKTQHVAQGIEGLLVMIAFTPYDLLVFFGCRPTPTFAKEFPGFFLEAIPVVVLDEIAIDDQDVKLLIFQDVGQGLKP